MNGEQGELLPAPVGPVGRLQLATRKAVELADMDPLDVHGAVLLVELATVIDRAMNAGPKQLYVVDKLVDRFLQACAQFGLDPSSRGGGGEDGFTQLMRELGAPGGTGTAVRDAPQR